MIGTGLGLLAPVGVLAAAADPSVVERWRDLGSVLWLFAAGAAALWGLLLGVLKITEPETDGSR